jgi:hypothetical protein
MPRATNNIDDTNRLQLKTCAGGFVVLRRLTYGQYLKRQGMAMEMQMATNSATKQSTMDIQMAQTKVAEFDFANCIVEHNLEDDNGNLLDFKAAFTLQLLDPRVGQEIGDAIDAMNNFEGDLGN